MCVREPDILSNCLAESSKTLTSTYTEYQNLGSLIHISKRVITQLEASDWFDRLLLLFGVLLFSSVVLYIIKKRTWDVGISWVSWLSQTKKSKETLATTIVTVTAQSIATAIATTIATATSSTPSTTLLDTLIGTASPAIAGIVIKDELWNQLLYNKKSLLLIGWYKFVSKNLIKCE